MTESAFERPNNFPDTDVSGATLPVADELDLESGAYALADNPEYYRQIKEFSLLTREEECELAERINQGDEDAFDTFVQANLRLVVFVAHKFNGRTNHMTLDDLVNEGNIGLMRALQKFDPEQGKFSTYAFKWIYATIDRSVKNQDRTIRLPVNIEEKLGTARRTEAKLMTLSGEQPTIEAVAEKMKIDPEKLAAMQQAATSIESLDSEKSSDGRDIAPLKGLIGVSPAQQPESIILRHEHRELLSKVIWDAMAELDEQERMVITGRYAFVTEKPLTLVAIAKHLGVSAPHVRALQTRAEEKLLPGMVKAFDKFGIPIEEMVDMSRLEF